jgi:hypothetical protein
MYSSTLSLSSALDGVEGKLNTPTALPQEKRTGTNNTVDRVGTTSGLMDAKNHFHPRGFQTLDRPGPNQ